ncbi:hypothetical protein GN958_ATG04336, partial [Phytophthora infestans]
HQSQYCIQTNHVIGRFCSHRFNLGGTKYLDEREQLLQQVYSLMLQKRQQNNAHNSLISLPCAKKRAGQSDKADSGSIWECCRGPGAINYRPQPLVGS